MKETEKPQQNKTRARVLSLCHQGQTADAISAALGLTTDSVEKIIEEAVQKSRILYVFMDREMPATIIDVCGLTKNIHIINLTDDLLSRAFGIRENPDWNDYEAFLESRCMPRTRYGIREELRELGVDSYDPFQIVEKTAGRVHGDGQWLRRMSSDWIAQYDTVRQSHASQAGLLHWNPPQRERELRNQLLTLLKKDEREEENAADES